MVHALWPLTGAWNKKEDSALVNMWPSTPKVDVGNLSTARKVAILTNPKAVPANTALVGKAQPKSVPGNPAAKSNAGRERKAQQVELSVYWMGCAVGLQVEGRPPNIRVHQHPRILTHLLVAPHRCECTNTQGCAAKTNHQLHWGCMGEVPTRRPGSLRSGSNEVVL